MLVIIVFGTHPVKTDLVFDSLDKCLEAEEVMHAEQESKFLRWRAVFRETESSLLTKEEALAKRRIGMESNMHPARTASDQPELGSVCRKRLALRRL